MSVSTKDLSTDPYAVNRQTEISDMVGIVHPLGPKVTARARRVVEKTHGDHPLGELLDILGLAEVSDD